MGMGIGFFGHRCSQLTTHCATAILAGSMVMALGVASSAKTATITWSTWLGGEQLKEQKEIITSFEKQNPDVKVKVLQVADYSQYISKILLMFASGTGPDVMHTTLYSSDDLIAKDLVKDVTSWAKASIKFNDYVKFSNIYQRKGRIIGGLESHTQVYPVFHNVELFKQAGVLTPNDYYYNQGRWDIDTFMLASRKLSSDTNGDGKLDKFGFLTDQSWETGYYPWMVAFGGTFWDEAKQQVTLTSPKTIEAVKFWANLHRENKGASGLESGKTAMWMHGSWAMNHYSWYQKKINWDIGWAPKAPGMTNRTYASVGADGIVYKGSKQPQAAWRLVEHFLSKETQMKKAKSRLVVPVMKSALRSDIYLQAPPSNMRVIGDMMENAADLPVFKYYLDVMAILDRHLNLAAAGKKAPEAACRDAETEANKFLAARKKK